MGESLTAVDYKTMPPRELVATAKRGWGTYQSQIPQQVREELGPIFEALVDKITEFDTS